MPSIFEQLRLHEGLREKPYLDSVGKWTIGVGRNLSDNGLSREEINVLLENDVAQAELMCRRYFPWFDGLDYVHKKVLLDLMFNMGPNKLNDFKRFLRMMAEGNFPEAAKALRHSLWAQQVKGRADRLIEMVRTGKDYTE